MTGKTIKGADNKTAAALAADRLMHGGGRWTVEQMRQALAERYGIAMSKDYCAKVMQGIADLYRREPWLGMTVAVTSRSDYKSAKRWYRLVPLDEGADGGTENSDGQEA